MGLNIFMKWIVSIVVIVNHSNSFFKHLYIFVAFWNFFINFQTIPLHNFQPIFQHNFPTNFGIHFLTLYCRKFGWLKCVEKLCGKSRGKTNCCTSLSEQIGGQLPPTFCPSLCKTLTRFWMETAVIPRQDLKWDKEIIPRTRLIMGWGVYTKTRFKMG